MKIRRSLILAAAALSLSGILAAGAMAQQQQPPAGGGAGKKRQGRGGGGQAGRQMPIIQALKASNLTTEQDAKIKTLLEKFRADMMALPQAERREKGRELNKKLMDDIDAILTPEQQKTFKKEMREIRQRGANQAGPFAGMTEALALTTDQKTKVEPILKTAQEQMTKLRQDQSVQGRERNQKMRAILEETREKIRPLLTPEQQVKLDAMKGRGAGGNGRGKKAAGAGA